MAPPPAGHRGTGASDCGWPWDWGILALLCLGGVGVFVSLYDGATEIKRSAPDAVVDNFLGAYLVNRDDNEAALYRARTAVTSPELEAYRTDIMTRREELHHVGIMSAGRACGSPPTATAAR